MSAEKSASHRFRDERSICLGILETYKLVVFVGAEEEKRNVTNGNPARIVVMLREWVFER